MKKIKVRNWERWQTYRSDRGMPPWIKLHRCLLRNPDWVSLTEQQRGQLVSMWILAADCDGSLPADAEMIARLCQFETIPDLNLFKDKGFLDFGASVAPPRRQGDASVTPYLIADACHGIADESKNPPTPRKRGGGERSAKPQNETPAPEVVAIVDHLNRVTGKHHSHDRGNLQIERALKRGATVEDCCRVIDHLWATWSPEWRQRINKVTPFRLGNFDGYLDEAGAGMAQATSTPQDPEAAARLAKIHALNARLDAERDAERAHIATTEATANA